MLAQFLLSEETFLRLWLAFYIVFFEFSNFFFSEVKRSDVKLSVLYKTLSAAMKDKHISNWSIVNTSLEEVFLRIIVNDEKGGNGDFSSGDDADDDVVINMRESSNMFVCFFFFNLIFVCFLIAIQIKIVPAIEYDLSSSDDDRDVIVKAMSRRSVASPRTPLDDAKMKVLLMHTRTTLINNVCLFCLIRSFNLYVIYDTIAQVQTRAKARQKSMI